MSIQGWRAGLRAFAGIQIFVVALLVSAASWAQQSVRVDVPAQPLGAALRTLAEQAGIEVLFPSDLVAGKQAPAVSGSMSAEQALGALLKGSNLEARQSEPNRFVIQAAKDKASAAPEASLPEVEVSDTVPSNPNLLPQPYAGGQVARGGQLGLLGNRDIMDTPFNQSNYTAELMQNQQVRHIADILANDPTAHANGSASTGADDFSIRGFYVQNTDLLFNGMPAVGPTFFNSMMSESIERVEVLKGPTAMLYSAAPDGSVGGTINLIPKRAGDAPLTQFTADYALDSQVGGHLDVGRRFGENKEFGVRFNGVFRDGDTAIDNQSRESSLLSVALDYRGERVRLVTDLGYQKQKLQGIRDYTSVAAGFAVPEAPDTQINYGGPNDFSNPEVYYGSIQGEFDIMERLTFFASAGGSERTTQYVLNNRFMVDAQGNLAAGTDAITADKMDALTTAAGLRGRFDTGPVRHEAVFAYNQLDRTWFRSSGTPFAVAPSNIYNPVPEAPLDRSGAPDPGDAALFQQYWASSIAIADTLFMKEDRIQLTLGLREQKLHSNFVNFNSDYKDDALTPMVGLVVKPWQHVSLFANYIEGLSEGAVAPPTSSNSGQGFPPFKTEQYEIGAKSEFGRFGTTVSIYQIAKPSGIIDGPASIFSIDGEQRNRGLDFNFYGEVSSGVRLLGGVALLDAELTKTEGGVNDGNTGPAAPKTRLVLGAEWDTPFIEGFTLTGRVTRNGEIYLDPQNTQQLPAWTRVDIGARYRISRTVIVRANIDNLLDENYWDGNAFGQITLSDPRTFSLSATFDF